MSDDQFQALLQSQRDTHRVLMWIGYMVTLTFVVVVIGPILQRYGLWNLMGW